MNTKQMTVAVFGHYDSRGGAMGIRIPGAATPDMIQRAKDMYDKDVFGWAEETGVTTAGVGREVDQIVANLLLDGSKPSDEDFMYVSTLFYPESMAEYVENGGDLEYGYQRSDVMLFKNAEGLIAPEEHCLEFVTFNDTDLEVVEKAHSEEVEAKIEAIPKPGTDATPEEHRAYYDKRNAIYRGDDRLDEFDELRLIRAAAQIRVINESGPMKANLGEDAVGFSIVGRIEDDVEGRVEA